MSGTQETSRLSLQVTGDREIAARDEEIAGLQRDLAFQAAEVARLRADVAARDGRLAGTREELAARDETVAQLQQDVARLQHRCVALQEMATTRAQVLESGDLHRLASGPSRHGDEVARLSAEIERLESAVRELHASTSWRVTAPIRALKNAVLRLRAYVHRAIVTAAGSRRSSTLLEDQVTLISRSGLFDPDYYSAQAAEVREGGLDPVAHYVTRGAAEGLDPHPLFETAYYRERAPDVVESGENPLLHYLRVGAARGIDPHPLFDTAYYRQAASPEGNPLVHYLARGAAEGRSPHPLFDPAFYLGQNPDVASSGEKPLLHYLRAGARAGHDPHPLFDTAYYRERAPDIVTSGENPLLHYLRTGAARGIDPHPLFDTAYYRQAASPEGNPLVHYLARGAAEGWSPHPLFDPAFYLGQNPDVASTGENPLLHYLQAGARAGRDPHPLFETAFYVEQKPEVAALGVNPLAHFVTVGPTPEFDPVSVPQPLPDTGICIVTPDVVGPVKNGGIGTACYHFARLLAEAGHAVTILFTIDLSPCRHAHWRNTYARRGIKFLSLSEMPPVTHPVHASNWFLERSWRVFKYLETKPYAVVHFQDWHANGFWSIKAKQLGLAFDRTTLTVMTHSPVKWQDDGMQQFGPEPIETAKLVWAETYAIEHCDVLLSPTRYMLDWLLQQGARLPESVFVTPNAYTENTDKARPTPEVDNDHLIFFGRLETRKGVHVLGEALRRLRREGGPLPRTVSFLGTLVTVNGQPAAEYLEALRESLGSVEFRVVDNLDHLGAREYIERSRGLVVIPSLVDNCPFVVIECIENRIPFLAATTGGIPGMVDARATFEPTPAALAGRLAERTVIDHAEMRHPYSVADAARIWRDLHGERGPLGERADSSPRPVREVGESPRVSVCIPFFEHERYLETLVAAFTGQSYPDLEVVVVNDRSGPQGREFARVAARARDRRFRFVSTEDRGVGAARNAAADAATGDLLLFFDSDNLPKGRDFVATLVRALRSSGADCVTCAYDIVPPDRLLPTEQDVGSTYRPYGACLEAAFIENVLGDSTMILPSSVFARVGGFPTKRASWEAHEFLLRLCFQGFKLETLPEALCYHRESPSSRDQPVNYFPYFQSLFEQLQEAPRGDLARILAAVGGPMLVARFGVRGYVKVRSR